MVAALVSKIIGLIYKSPLSATLGNESFGCFSFAQNVYLILLMIASYSIPRQCQRSWRSGSHLSVTETPRGSLKEPSSMQ